MDSKISVLCDFVAASEGVTFRGRCLGIRTRENRSLFSSPLKVKDRITRARGAITGTRRNGESGLGLASISPASYPHVGASITHNYAPCGDPGTNISALAWPGHHQDGFGTGSYVQLRAMRF